jgi:micrococcal nuclease
MRSFAVVGSFLLITGISAIEIAGRHSEAATPSDFPSYRADFCTVTDGDTIRCGEERIRLVEIDAPEMPGHCRRGRTCAPGDPHASKAALERFLAGRRVYVQRLDTDHYGRTIANVMVLREGLRGASCAQIRGRYAIRQLKWADFKITTTECP